MQAQWFDSKEDIIPEVQVWHSARGLGQMDADKYPDTGAIVPGVAVVFAYLTNSKFAFIEGTASNPAVDRETRLKALADCWIAVEDGLKACGYKSAWTITSFDSLIQVAKDVGFEVSAKDHAYLIKELG